MTRSSFASFLVFGLSTVLATVSGCGSPPADADGAVTRVASSPLGAGAYTFVAGTATGLCLDVAGAETADGTPIQQARCNGSGAQIFRIEPDASSSARLFNPASGKCVDVEAGSTESGARIQLYACNGTRAQSFHVEAVAGDRVQIRNRDTDKCLDVPGADPEPGAALQLYACNRTPAQLFSAVTPGLAAPADPAPPGTPDVPGTPDAPGDGAASGRIVGGYYPNWTPSPIRIRDIPRAYNLVYLFNARPVGGAPGTTGEIYFDLPGDGRGAATSFVADLGYVRATEHRKIVLSVGGAGFGMSFPERAKSERFVASVDALYARFGGFDGIDLNTFEADQDPDTAEMIWIAKELKRRHPGFLVTAPPAPWNARDKAFCKAMVDAGALDYAAPQYYDGPNLATRAYVVSSVAEWTSLLGASHVVVGFGIASLPNYMTADEALATWNAVATTEPGLRGAFAWTIHNDEALGFPFAGSVAKAVAR